MLEIVVLHRLCRSVGRLSREKGLPTLWFQALLIAAFLGGEVYGGMATAVFTTISAPPGHHEPPLGLMYLAAVCCAAGASLGVFGLAWLLPRGRQNVATRQCLGCGESLVLSHSAHCPMCGAAAHQEPSPLAAA